MLKLKGITKTYVTANDKVEALKGIDIEFRKAEFVSILGQSGCGKTTLLNIIGGLDRYTKGDLIINGKSTKEFKDRDWDSYRNHSVGFVFQSYNLIPHQTVLSNVELALTIGGISKKTRRERAATALELVGLGDQMHKRPNQLSGGQMQRVAIARALVNNPEIILADEPTGALDTKTSVQIMEILKEVSKDRLVIMVTHNPELAETYSTRIVKIRDGELLDDTKPFDSTVEKEEKQKAKASKKLSMSIFTALSLSLNNLLTKKGRTILTSFAGSIGIIGIAMILSLSTGFQNYIDKIQEDTLTSYPFQITSETADGASMLLSMTGATSKNDATGENVKESQNIREMFTKIGSNDLKSFKYHLETNKAEVDKMVSFTRYTYGITPIVYTKDVTGEIVKLNPSNLMNSISGNSSAGAMMSSAGITVFSELVDNQEMIEEQYELLKGTWPKEYNEVIIILPKPNQISDMLLYGLGLRDLDELEDMIADIMQQKEVNSVSKPLEYTYDDLMNLTFKLVNSSDLYKYNSKYGIYENRENDDKYIKDLYNKSENIKVVGIVTPKSSESMSMLAGVGYTRALTEHVIKTAAKSEIVKKQLADSDINVFSGKAFDDDEETMGLDFQDMISIDKDMLASAFGGNVSEKTITDMTTGYITEISNAITVDTLKAESAFTTALSDLTKGVLNTYIENNKTAGMPMVSIKLSQVDTVVDDYFKTNEAKTILSKLEQDYVVPADTFKMTYATMIKAFLKGYIMATGTEVPNVDIYAEKDYTAMLMPQMVEPMVTAFVSQAEIQTAAKQMGAAMTEATMQKTILTKVGELAAKLTTTMASAFKVDEKKIAAAFKFDLDESEIRSIIETMTKTSTVQNATTNLITLGYQDMNSPTTMQFYFENFENKEKFIAFLDAYNDKMEKEDDEKVIKYTDVTGILMSSVKVIVDSVSYVLIAFVSISLVVSSIMIGIITYISVLERTKEIGVLRAIGASKKDISRVFNAETFIVGLLAGLIGIGSTLALLIPTNAIIHAATNNPNITAVLPTVGGVVLVILSVVLTLIGGLIPSKLASKKDPVIALRTE